MAQPKHALVTADLARLPGLRDEHGWEKPGAALGLAATGGVGGGLGVLATLDGHGLMGLGLAAAVIGPAMVMGALSGRRWKRWMRRDGGVVSVRRWLFRLGREGAYAGGLSAAATCTAVGLASGAPHLGSFLTATATMSAVSAVAGATLLAGLGMPFVLGLSRGKRPWAVFGATFLTVPPLLVGVATALSFLLR